MKATLKFTYIVYIIRLVLQHNEINKFMYASGVRGQDMGLPLIIYGYGTISHKGHFKFGRLASI